MKNQKTIRTFGAFEYISLPDFGVQNVLAKIDTGAYSGSIHCSLVEEVVKASGKNVLRFRPLHGDHTVELSEYKKLSVKSSNGETESRYIVKTTLKVEGDFYPLTIGLSDRSKMKYDVLIGRRFLRANSIMVDVRQNKELDEDFMEIGQ